MKLFISWSGERSKELAELFDWWIPTVINAVDPWLSASHIEKGTRWSTEISNQLQDTKFGLICLTSDNLKSSWILFEAGALSKSLDKTFVCPYLLDITPEDLEGPLAQFQSTKSNKEDTKKLMYSINKALESNALSYKILDRQFDRWWPDLESGLASILKTTTSSKKSIKTDRELLEEVLLRVSKSPNEYLLSQIQQAFPDITLKEQDQIENTLLRFYAGSFTNDQQPAKLTTNPDGTISVSVLSLEKIESD